MVKIIVLNALSISLCDFVSEFNKLFPQRKLASAVKKMFRFFTHSWPYISLGNIVTPEGWHTYKNKSLYIFDLKEYRNFMVETVSKSVASFRRSGRTDADSNFILFYVIMIILFFIFENILFIFKELYTYWNRLI